MKIIRVLNFRSLDAKKQDNRNKPEDFTTRFKTQLVLDDNTNYYLALEELSMSASWHNITPKYINDKIKYSKDNGVSYEEMVRWKTRSAECGVRSVESVECGNCGVWKARSVESAECGK